MITTALPLRATCDIYLEVKFAINLIFSKTAWLN